jgi:hypothetical protein
MEVNKEYLEFGASATTYLVYDPLLPHEVLKRFFGEEKSDCYSIAGSAPTLFLVKYSIKSKLEPRR